MSEQIDREITPRVNAAMLPKWVGRTVRLTCKVIKFNDASRATVEAPDGGQVIVSVLRDDIGITDQYVEVIGKVVDPTTISMLGCISMGTDLDMKLVNDTINLIHDERYFKKMFSY